MINFTKKELPLFTWDLRDGEEIIVYIWLMDRQYLVYYIYRPKIYLDQGWIMDLEQTIITSDSINPVSGKPGLMSGDISWPWC